MIGSVSAVVCLFVWCVTMVLTLEPADAEEHLHGELDIETNEEE